jgi:hypothetical protein
MDSCYSTGAPDELFQAIASGDGERAIAMLEADPVERIFYWH